MTSPTPLTAPPIIHKLVATFAQNLAAYHAAKSPLEQERLARQIQAADRAIDALVYGLYGLSEAEIGIVEGGG
jgi:hypothetical protein